MAYEPWQPTAGPLRRLGQRAYFQWRQATARHRQAPQFLVLGAMKAATTTLFDAIAQHPDFRGPLRKEIQYFSTERWRPWSWYLAHFPRQEPATFTGEASPYYLYHPATPALVARQLPEVAPIAVLRDPIDRAWSQYKYIHGDDDPERFAAACHNEPQCNGNAFADPRHNDPAHRRDTPIARSRYAEQLERWDQQFGPDRVLVLTTEQLHDASTFDAVFDHIGVPRFQPTLRDRNVGKNTPLPQDIRDRLWPLVADDVERLRQRVPDLPW